MSSHRNALDKLGNEVFGVLARSIRSRVVEISRSGCLLESRHRVEEGTVGELRLEVDGELLMDDVRVTRCVRVEGAGASYVIGAEFVQTRRPTERSIRRAVTEMLRSLAQPATGTARSYGKSAERGDVAASGVDSESTGGVVMKDVLARFVRDEDGQDLIEYGLLAGIVTALTVAAIQAIGPKVQDYITDLNTMLPAVD